MIWKNFPSPVDSLQKGPARRNFDVSFDVCLNKHLNKPWSCSCLETPWHPWIIMKNWKCNWISRRYWLIWRFAWWHFPRYWPFVLGIHRSPANSSQKVQLRRALMFSLICAWINGWVNNGEAGDLRSHRAHYDVIVMTLYAAQTHTYSNHSNWRSPQFYWLTMIISCKGM